MKRKIVNLGVVLVLLFSLGLIVGPASPAAGDEVYALGSYATYDLSQYDVRYVAKFENSLGTSHLAGDDTNGNGSIAEPWRTITMAVDELPYNSGSHMKDPFGTSWTPDLIVVGPSIVPPSTSGEYGGSGDPENIYIDNPVVLVSYSGADVTHINVSDQSYIIGGVVEIVSDDVIIDDFTIASNGGVFPTGGGAATGVYAHGTPMAPIHNVQVLNCRIKIDQYDWVGGVGIEMDYVKWAVIHNNNIDVGIMGGDVEVGPESLGTAFGIIMFGCFEAEITSNELDVQGDYYAIGISMFNCPRSWVGVAPPGGETGTPAPNDIEVKAGSDVTAYGIQVCMSDLIDIMYNSVEVEATGDFYAAAYGIQVCYSGRIDIIDNYVYVESNLPDSIMAGFMMARGIAVKGCDGPNNVSRNAVTVAGSGYVNETVYIDDFNLEDDVIEDLAEFEPILLDSLAIDQSFVSAMGSAVGISVTNSPATAVTENSVNVMLSVRIISGDDISAYGSGGGCAIGISGLSSPGINVSGNTVDVYDYVYAQVIAEYVRSSQFAIGGATSVSLGIILDYSPGYVGVNAVNADADVTAYIEAAEVIYDTGAGAEESALALLDAEILGAIYLQLYESLGDEMIDIELSGNLPGIQTIGGGDAAAIGIGIMVMNSDVVTVELNVPVSGTGDVTLDVISSEIGMPWAEAGGGGMGLGIGIAIINTRGATVSNNVGVNGSGTADVDISATHETMVQNAIAMGGGAGIGVGILLCGMTQYVNEAEVLPENQCWPDGPVVTGNVVTATGIAGTEEAPIKVSAEDLNPSHESCATGNGLAVALGIAGVWYPGIMIQGNTVDADASAWVETDSEAVHSFDPISIGGAVAIGIGITTIGCDHAQILYNVASGDGIAYGEVGATENVLMLWGAYAYGGSLGLGIGIFVIDCPRSLVQGNSHLDDETCLIEQAVVGRGDAECIVEATSYYPLSEAYAYSLSTGIGIGIAVAYSPCTDVINCNVAAGEGTARVSATYDADFGAEGAAGFAGSYDMFMKLTSCHPRFLEEDIDELDPQGRSRHRFGDVNYNSMIDDVPLGTNTLVVVAVEDAGLLKIGEPCLDATRNWWNDPTGPSGFGPGNGEPILWSGHPVCFVPWLYVEHGEVLCEQVGKFGFYLSLCKGLNTLSTPIALEQNAMVIPMGYSPSRAWGDILANSGLTAGDFKFTYRWDPAGQIWVPVSNGTYLDPLDAWYIYLRDTAPTDNLILFINSADAFGAGAHPYSMPTRQLYAGWNLIGPNPQFPDIGMPVEDVLSSVELTSEGTPGYTQVISPIVNCQESWVYVPDGKKCSGPDMLIGNGYWVWMLNDIVLVGFGFSPLPAP
jgi:hypothetical protein